MESKSIVFNPVFIALFKAASVSPCFTECVSEENGHTALGDLL